MLTYGGNKGEVDKTFLFCRGGYIRNFGNPTGSNKYLESAGKVIILEVLYMYLSSS
jgi:hypothetical protein